LNNEQKLYFLYGALYMQAIEMKKDGCFNDLSVNQVVQLLVNDLLKNNYIFGRN